MPHITVTTTIKTVFEIPEGLTIEQIRHQALPELGEAEEQVDEVTRLHSKVVNQVYIGDADELYQSVEHAITEGAQQRL